MVNLCPSANYCIEGVLPKNKTINITVVTGKTASCIKESFGVIVTGIHPDTNPSNNIASHTFNSTSSSFVNKIGQ